MLSTITCSTPLFVPLMDCKFSSTSLQIHHNLSTKQPKSHQFSASTLNCRGQSKQESPTTSTQTQPQASSGLYNIKFQTLQACKLGISRHPDFVYNAEGGVGTATSKKDNEELSSSFDVESLYIPALTGATTMFPGLPLLPLLKIEIAPEVFQRTINTETGKVELEFRARFWFSTGDSLQSSSLGGTDHADVRGVGRDGAERQGRGDGWRREMQVGRSGHRRSSEGSTLGFLPRTSD